MCCAVQSPLSVPSTVGRAVQFGSKNVAAVIFTSRSVQREGGKDAELIEERRRSMKPPLAPLVLLPRLVHVPLRKPERTAPPPARCVPGGRRRSSPCAPLSAVRACILQVEHSESRFRLPCLSVALFIFFLAVLFCTSPPGFFFEVCSLTRPPRWPLLCRALSCLATFWPLLCATCAFFFQGAVVFVADAAFSALQPKHTAAVGITESNAADTEKKYARNTASTH